MDFGQTTRASASRGPAPLWGWSDATLLDLACETCELDVFPQKPLRQCSSSSHLAR